LFSLTSCLHETVHQTFSPSPRVNVWLGRLIAIVLLMTYTGFRETHIRHHAYMNQPRDWELWPYSRPQASLWFRRLFVWADLFLGFLATPFIYYRIAVYPASPIDRRARMTILAEAAVTVAVWTLVLSWLDYMRLLSIRQASWSLPFFVMTFIQTGRKLTEHLGMASYDPMLGTRTVMGAGWITRLTNYIQFDIFVHGVHHRHPRLVHGRLREKMRSYIAANPDVRYPVFDKHRQATWNMLPHVLLNPAVGMNAGGGQPSSGGEGDTTDFLSDVHRNSLPD